MSTTQVEQQEELLNEAEKWIRGFYEEERLDMLGHYTSLCIEYENWLRKRKDLQREFPK